MSALKWTGLAIALMGAIWLLARDPSPAVKAATTSESVEPAQHDEVEKLQAQVRNLERRVAQQQNALEAAAEPESVVAAAPVEQHAAPEPLSGEEASGRLKAYFAETFEGEHYDRQRSEEYLKATREIFETVHLPVESIEAMDCRESMCRMTLRHSPDFERDSVSRIFGHSVLRYGSFDFLQEGRTIAYVGAGAPLVTPPPSTLPATAVAIN